jgi:hypothetical protein
MRRRDSFWPDLFGDAGIITVFRGGDFLVVACQMHDMIVFKPILKEALSMEERAKALALLMFLKEKRDKTV